MHIQFLEDIKQQIGQWCFSRELKQNKRIKLYEFQTQNQLNSYLMQQPRNKLLR